MSDPRRDDILAQGPELGGYTYRLDPPPSLSDGTIDCSLFVLKAYALADLPFPVGVRTAEQIRQACTPIGWSDVLPGDLLFFENTYDAGPPSADGHIASHIGISLGAGTRHMWDAHERDGNDVAITDIGTPYWQSKLFEARRLPALVGAVATPPSDPPKVDPWQFFTAEQIAAASGCPIDAIRQNWPRLVEQLDHCGINDRATQIAMIATIAIESASTFRPVREAFFLGEPEPAETWRKNNLHYYPWYGRGFIQLTWQENYAALSQKVNDLWGAGGAIDLVARPDDALDPDVSAATSALYFRDHGGDGLTLIPKAAAGGDWSEVRRLVQGGTDGLDRLVAIATALLAIPDPALSPTFDLRAEIEAILARHDDAALATEIRQLLARVPA